MRPNSEPEPDFVAELGRGGTAYLYRVAESTRPAGVGVYSQVEPEHGAVVRLSIVFPWATFSTHALVHWSARVNSTLRIVGLKLYNPDEFVTQAMNRAATLLPVFTYDDTNPS